MGAIVQRHRAVGPARLRLGVPDLQRLHAPPIRLAAMMEMPVIYVFTHDSHRRRRGRADAPADRAADRAAGHPGPGRCCARPTRTRWPRPGGSRSASTTSRPALALSRQALPTFDRSKYAAAAGLARGAYVLADCRRARREVILIGTGSEVQLCVGAYEALTAEGVKARVVSHAVAGSCSRARTRPIASSVLPPGVTARLAVEQAVDASAGTAMSGRRARSSACTRSAPRRRPKALQKKFGFTPEQGARSRAQACQRTARHERRDAAG